MNKQLLITTIVLIICLVPVQAITSVFYDDAEHGLSLAQMGWTGGQANNDSNYIEPISFSPTHSLKYRSDGSNPALINTNLSNIWNGLYPLSMTVKINTSISVQAVFIGLTSVSVANDLLLETDGLWYFRNSSATKVGTTTPKNNNNWINASIKYYNSTWTEAIINGVTLYNGTNGAVTPDRIILLVSDNDGYLYVDNINITSSPITSTYLTLTNKVNNSFINYFCVTYNNGTYSNSSCTSTGTINFENIIGNTNFFWYNISNNTYYNVTSNYTLLFGNTYSFTNTTYQSLLNISTYQLFTNRSISSFNTTNALLNNATPVNNYTIIPANNGSNNIRIDVTGNYSLNFTATVNNPLTTQTYNATGIYDSIYSFTANNTNNNQLITNFNISITNNTLGGILLRAGTTNGSLNLSIITGYYYLFNFTTPNGTYQNSIANLPSNASNHYYQFKVMPATAINITIRDATTAAIINQNVTININSLTVGQTVYTTTGNYYITNITPDTYSITLQAINYTQNQYSITTNSGIITNLTVYLQQNASTILFQLVDSINSNTVISGALITQTRIVNDTSNTISTRTTDITGRTQFNYVPGVQYQFIIIATGYQSETFTLNPVLFSEYTIKLDRTTSLTQSTDFQSVYVTYTPRVFYNNQNNNINITFNAPLATMTHYNYTIQYPGGSTTGSGTNPYGETFNTSITITGANITDKVNITLSYKPTIGNSSTFTYSNIIVYSATNTFMSNYNNKYGMGLVEQALVGTVIILIVAGLITIGLGAIPGLVMSLLLMSFFIYTGLWDWWLAGISFLIGFVIIAARTD